MNNEQSNTRVWFVLFDMKCHGCDKDNPDAALFCRACGTSLSVSEDGDIEKWVGKVNKEKVKEYVSLVADRLNSFKK